MNVHNNNHYIQEEILSSKNINNKTISIKIGFLADSYLNNETILASLLCYFLNIYSDKIIFDIFYLNKNKIIKDQLTVNYSDRIKFKSLINALKIILETSSNEHDNLLFKNKVIAGNNLNISIILGQIDINKCANNKQIILNILLDKKIISLNYKFSKESSIVHSYVDSLMRGTINTLKFIIKNSQNEKIANIPILTKSDYQELIYKWNNTEKKINNTKTIHQLFEAQVRLTPNKIAIVSKHHELSFTQLNKKANKLANFICKNYKNIYNINIKPETLIATYLERNVDFVVTILAILKCGAAYIPLDINEPDKRLQLKLQDSKCKFIISNNKKVVSKSKQYLHVPNICLDKIEVLLKNEPSDNLSNINKVSNASYVIYTSGSTGKPKGVIVEHRSLVNQIYSLGNKINNGNVLFKTKVNFDASIWEYMYPLLSGNKIVILEEDKIFDQTELAKTIINNKVDIIQFTPSHLNFLIKEKHNFLSKCQNLKSICLGGEPCSARLINDIYVNINTNIFNLYGPTESCIQSNISKLDINNLNIITIGPPINNYKVYILNSMLQPVPVGVPGELYISSISLARSYLNDQPLTDKKFIENIFITGTNGSNEYNRMYKTGDIARWLQNGDIEFISRVDNQVKIRGNRIELGEIENNLSKHHLISKCVTKVLTKRDRKYICAYYTLKKEIDNYNVNQLVTQLTKYLSSSLPDYMIPNFFIKLTHLPLNNNGKIDKESLPEPCLSKCSSTSFAPKNELENILYKTWCEILHLKRININDNFFSLGGDSLISVSLASKINKKLGLSISPFTILEYPSIVQLHAYLEKNFGKFKPNEKVYRLRTKTIKEFPLSEIQNNIWFDIQTTGNDTIYNEQITIDINNTKLDINRLNLCINLLANQYESLKCKFIIKNSQVLHRIEKEFEYQLAYYDVSKEDSPTDKFKYLINKLVRKRISLNRLPLIKFYLFKINFSYYKFFIVSHHMIADGYSFYKVFLPALERLYTSKKDASLINRHQTFNDYSKYIINNQELHSNIIKFNFWKEFTSKYIPTELRLSESNKTQAASKKGNQIVFKILKNDTQKINSLSKKNKISLFSTLLSIFYILIHNFTKNEYICISTVLAGRNDKRSLSIFGNLMKNSLLAVNINEELSFLTFSQKVHNRNIEIIKNNISYDNVLKLYRSRNYNENLLKISFVLEPNQNSNSTTWRYNQLQAHPGSVKNDLYFEIDDCNNELLGRIEYNSALYNEKSIQILYSSFICLISNITRDPYKKINEFSIINKKTYNQIIYGWNKNKSYFPCNETLHQLFENQAKKTPNKIAVFHKNMKMTFKEIDDRSNQISNYIKLKYKELYNTSLESDTLIPICVHRNINMLISILGILKANAAYVPIDPEYPSARKKFIIKDTNPKLLLFDYKAKTKSQKINLPDRKVIIIDRDKTISNMPKINIKQDESKSSQLAYVIYTSGSSGAPKGILGEHKGILNRFFWMWKKYPWQKNEVFCAKSAFTFIDSIWELFGGLLKGIPIAIASDIEYNNPNLLIDILNTHHVTRFVAIPELLEILPLKKLKYINFVTSSGSPLSSELAKRIYNDIPNVTLLNLYGSSEVAADVLYYQVPNKNYNSCIIGKPINNITAYVLNKKNKPVSINISGELHIGGKGLAREYLNNSKLSKEKFISNPYQTESENQKGENQIIYKTGDIVRRLPNGNIEFLGRMDDQVKILGNRIELNEIKYNLLKHPSIIQSAIKIYRKNNDNINNFICAYYKLKDNKTLKKEILEQYLKKKLPKYMIPSYLIQVNNIPLNVNGKIDYKSLPSPTINLCLLKNDYLPQTDIENKLSAIWSKILFLRTISVHDNFFNIGGNSLLAFKLLNEINKNFNKNLQINSIFTHATIHEQAYLIANNHEITVCNNTYISNKIVNYKKTINKINIQKLPFTGSRKNILLTGASGFLGVYLLEELLSNRNTNVYCILRGNNKIDIYNKLIKSLKFYKKEYLIRSKKITLINGDLSKKDIGLSNFDYETITEKIDIIFHNGANVNHIYNYETLRMVNVNSTFELIKMASISKLKKINFISTYDVSYLSPKMIKFKPNINGYIQTKYISERLLQLAIKSKIPTTIFRPGNITGDSINSISNYSINNFYLLLKGCIQLGYAPAWKHETVDILPVNIISNLIIELGRKDLSLDKTYNLDNDHKIKWIDYISLIRKKFEYSINLIPIQQWKNKLKNIDEKNSLFHLKDYYLNYKERSNKKENGIQPRVNESILNIPSHSTNLTIKYINYLKEINFLP
ncbi:MAG: amino acid adenylation domain-containing protein [bacterium]|nr:amino acid adenylation domain-containing protein [bacterium]